MQVKQNAPLLILASAFFLSLMYASLKVASPRIPVYETVFFRSIVSVLLLGILLKQRGVKFRASHLPLILFRSLAGLLAMVCHFYAIGHLALGDAMILINSSPIFVAILSFLFLGERMSRRIIGWTCLAWVGILLILRPQLNFLNYAGLIALLGGFFTAVVIVVIHQSTERDHPLRIVFYFTLTCAVVPLPVMAQHFIAPTPWEWIALLAAGIFGTIGQIFMTKGYSLEDVSKLSPLTYFGVVLSYFLGIIFWKEIPSIWSAVGGLIVILSCIQIARRGVPVPLVD